MSSICEVIVISELTSIFLLVLMLEEVFFLLKAITFSNSLLPSELVLQCLVGFNASRSFSLLKEITFSSSLLLFLCG